MINVVVGVLVLLTAFSLLVWSVGSIADEWDTYVAPKPLAVSILILSATALIVDTWAAVSLWTF